MNKLSVLKTYKIYIGGELVRSESGRYFKSVNKQNNFIADICLSSRKDFRNAEVAARKAFEGWSSRAHFNRGQILYRIAEMLEGKKSQFIEELILQGGSKNEAIKEVELSIERCIYYSGWCDKFSALFSSVNPVASSHFNFSVTEPTGVVAIIASDETSLIGLLSVLLPVIAGGNTCVILASETKPLCAVTFAEVLATSDLPAGVANILTGKSSELHTHFSSHMDVNAVLYCKKNKVESKTVQECASLNVKRSFVWNYDWTNVENQNPYFILDFQEVKTTWHPIEKIGISGMKY